ncbi:MAG: DUF488 domain-containing protein [Methanotrichaceae archaeon]|nr:DUF488 domain-containing protein [Methanotrichaceae archaeon]
MMTSNIATDRYIKFQNAWSIARRSNIRHIRPDVKQYLDLAPSDRLLDEYNKGLMTWDEYAERYQRETLDKLDPAKVYSELGQNAVLLCVCARGKLPQCHRRLVAEWFETNLGIYVPEFAK